MTKSTCWVLTLLLLGYAFAVETATADDSAAPVESWQLRDNYNFDGPSVDLGYAVDFGEWRIVAPALGEVFKSVESAVVLGDDTVVTPRDCGAASTTRDRAENPIGPAVVYLTQCPVNHGLKITHKVAGYKNRSGLTVHLEAVNAGTEPISIKALKSMIVESGEIAHVQMASDGDNGPYVFTNAAEKVAVLLGVIPIGGAKTTVAFREDGGSIVGGATASFDPPLVLQPGERVETDPVMVIFMYEDPEEARDYFDYTLQDVTGAKEEPAAPAIASESEAKTGTASSADEADASTSPETGTVKENGEKSSFLKRLFKR